jgi:hypothetical protein
MPLQSEAMTDGHTDTDTVAELLALEQQRCRCLTSDDFDGLRALLHPELHHTHNRGNSDTLDSYLDYVGRVVQFRGVQRGDLRVRVYGNTAVMSGTQTNHVGLRGKPDEARVEAQVIQVWVREEGGPWRLVAFQATPLGAPPPAVAR